QPGVPVVPVAVAADPLREAGRRRGDDRPRRRERHQLEREGGTLDGLPPPAVVLRLPDPGLPEAERVAKLLPAERVEAVRGRPLAVAAAGDDEGSLAPLLEEEVGGEPVAVGGARQGRQDVERSARRREAPSPRRRSGRDARPPVVEGGAALHAERDRPADAADEPHDLVILRALAGGAG